MKYALAAAGTVLAITAAANAETVWQGDIFVTSATSACASVGVSVGDDRQAIFAPGTLPGNGSSDQIAIFRPRGSATLLVRLSGTLDKATSFQYYAINHSATQAQGTYQNQGPFAVTPPKISATNMPSVVTVTYSWKNNGVTNCNMTLTGNLTRRPGNLPQ